MAQANILGVVGVGTPWFIGGTLAVAAGAILLMDDAADIGLFDNERPDFWHPNFPTNMRLWKSGKKHLVPKSERTTQPIHHWLIGVLILILGVILFLVGLLFILRALNLG